MGKLATGRVGGGGGMRGNHLSNCPAAAAKGGGICCIAAKMLHLHCLIMPIMLNVGPYCCVAARFRLILQRFCVKSVPARVRVAPRVCDFSLNRRHARSIQRPECCHPRPCRASRVPLHARTERQLERASLPPSASPLSRADARHTQS